MVRRGCDWDWRSWKWDVVHCLGGSAECIGGIGCAGSLRTDHEQVYRPYLLAGLVAVPLALEAQRLSVVFQIRLFSFIREFTARTVTILTWPSRSHLALLEMAL